MSGAPPIPALEPLVISAPFANYVQPAFATPTLGTFTRERRPGRVWRILKTVRYHFGIDAWVNLIGLRNPGLGWLAERVRAGRVDVSDKLVSIHGFSGDDWAWLLDACAPLQPLGIELNMSCPNVGEVNWPGDLFARALATGVPVVAKLPPVRFGEMAAQALEAGVRCFHCCNTLPVPAGGMSGKPLMPVALECIGRVRAMAHEAGVEVAIIGGGGITRPADVDRYRTGGATHVAVGSLLFDPRYGLRPSALRPFCDRSAGFNAGDGIPVGVAREATRGNF